ncbi:MAG: GNAT family protein [Micropepsaceae bacterium]
MIAPRLIRLESLNYVLRSMALDDEMGSWGEWMSDAETAQMLNARPVRLSVADFRRYVQGFDRVNNHLLGLFAKDSGAFVGVWAVYIDWPKSEFLVNVLVGLRDERGKGARKETSDLINRYFFEDLGLLNQHCFAVASNHAIIGVLQAKSWTLVGREMKPAASGAGNIELLHFQLTREAWRNRPS